MNMVRRFEKLEILINLVKSKKPSSMKKITTRSIAAVGIALLTLAGANAQTNITQWTFDNLAVASNSSPSPSIGSGVATPLGMNVYTTGTNTAGAANSNDITTASGFDSNNTASTNEIWRIRGANGWNSAAAIGTQGAEFAVSTAGFTNISLSFDLLITAQGEANFQIDYTTNGSTWLNATVLSISGTAKTTNGTAVIADYVTNNTSNANIVNGTYIHTDATNDSWFDGVTVDLSGVSNVNNNTNFAFEVVNATTGSSDVALKANGALNNSSGNWRFDDVTVNGVQAVPEPATYVLFGLGALGLVLVYRRKKA